MWNRDAQLHRVLEQGTGCPAALAILYMEVCARLGLPLSARILEHGRYLVLWPMQQAYAVDGQQVVIDAYSQGVPVLADEVWPQALLQSHIPLDVSGSSAAARHIGTHSSLLPPQGHS